MSFDLRAALQLYLEEQAAELQMHSLKPGGEQVIGIPAIGIHVTIDGKQTRFDIKGLDVRRAE